MQCLVNVPWGLRRLPHGGGDRRHKPSRWRPARQRRTWTARTAGSGVRDRRSTCC